MPRILIVAVLALLCSGCIVVASGRGPEPSFEVNKASANSVEAATFPIRNGTIETEVCQAWQINVEIAPVGEACLHGATFRVLRRGSGGAALAMSEARVEVEPLFGNDQRRYRLIAFLDEDGVGSNDLIVEANSNGDRMYIIFRPTCPNRFDIFKVSPSGRQFELHHGFWRLLRRSPRLIGRDEELELLVAASDADSMQ